MALFNKLLLPRAVFSVVILLILFTGCGQKKPGIYINNRKVPMTDVHFSPDGTFRIPRRYPVVAEGDKVIITTVEERLVNKQLYQHFGWTVTLKENGTETIIVGPNKPNDPRFLDEEGFIYNLHGPDDPNNRRFLDIAWSSPVGYTGNSISGLFTATPLGDGRYRIDTSTYEPYKYLGDAYRITTPRQSGDPRSDYGQVAEYHHLRKGVYIIPEIGAIDWGVIIVVK
ncbi:hypothetical protein JXA59_01735 [Patescibacteria group bacterium]|nr:hypothetical protein [Patescibacteria group bacterium]